MTSTWKWIFGIFTAIGAGLLIILGVLGFRRGHTSLADRLEESARLRLEDEKRRAGEDTRAAAKVEEEGWAADQNHAKEEAEREARELAVAELFDRLRR